MEWGKRKTGEEDKEMAGERNTRDGGQQVKFKKRIALSSVCLPFVVLIDSASCRRN